MAVAEKYMKLAGYPTGKYTGSKPVVVVGGTGEPDSPDAQIVNQTLKNLGFQTKLTLVEPSTMYSKYCNVPKEEVEVCPNVGWIADFGDGQAVLDATFNGRLIDPNTGNVNWGQTDDPKINAAMDAAELLVGAAERADAWAKIDDELVEDAAAIPFDWDKQAVLEGKDVRGVGDLWNSGLWDLSFTSLK
jgi:peptide/nickel transport system substrate-binding protein